ncbi:hypothetical protein [Gordonia liuliyuniae]|uniref:Integral membrane protein n=1 Tax=Gordonia liuliyuniae TaxID=2911517 RepID=A0ABS9ISS0_9ACTN|nr:hypothetical protein [Gordonia liuliyuniae]MCF8588596.1 hypothetical protein [Gordonia liuliyuniae]
MRSVASGLFTVVAMIAVIIAVPSMWVSQRVVSTDGFAASAGDAARDSQVQDYFAEKVAASVEEQTSVPLAGTVVEPLAREYTRSDGFVQDFQEIARQQHDWLFTAPGPETDTHVMDVNVTPMVNRVLASANLPTEVTVDRPIYIGIDQHRLTAGSMESTGRLVSATSWTAVIVAAVAAILALLIANRRSTVLAWLGVGVLLSAAGAFGIAQYIRWLAGDKAADTDEAARRTVEVVADGVSSDLIRTSAIVGAVGVLVIVAGLLLRVVGGRQPRV